MEHLLSLLLGFIAFFFFAYWYLNLHWPHPKFPPGPFIPVPVLTKLPWSEYFGMSPLTLFKALRKEYGNTFSVHLGHRRVVMMSAYEDVRGIFAKKINKRPEEIVNHWRDNRFINFVIFVIHKYVIRGKFAQ